MAVLRSNILVDLSNSATLAAVNVTLAAAVAAVAATFLPEDIEPERFSTNTATAQTRRDCISLICGKAPMQSWLAVTASAVIAVDLTGLSVAAANAAIAAVLVTQEAAGKQLRKGVMQVLTIGGQQSDCWIGIFSDGAPAVS